MPDQQRREQGLTVDISGQVALLDGWIENLPRRTPSIRGVKSIEADIVEAAVVRVRKGRMYSYRASWTDEPICQFLSRLSVRLLLLHRGAPFFLLPLWLSWSSVTVIPESEALSGDLSWMERKVVLPPARVSCPNTDA